MPHLEGTGLSVAYWKVDFKRVNVAKAVHNTHHPLWHDSEYLVKLVSDLPAGTQHGATRS